MFESHCPHLAPHSGLLCGALFLRLFYTDIGFSASFSGLRFLHMDLSWILAFAPKLEYNEGTYGVPQERHLRGDH